MLNFHSCCVTFHVRWNLTCRALWINGWELGHPWQKAAKQLLKKSIILWPVCLIVYVGGLPFFFFFFLIPLCAADMPKLAHAQQQLFHNPPLPHCSLFSVFLIFFCPFTYRLAPTLTFPWGQMTSFSSQDSCLSSLVLITHKHAPCRGACAEAAWLTTVRCIMNISLNASFCLTQTLAYTHRLWSIRHSSTYANLLWVLLHAFLYVACTCV